MVPLIAVEHVSFAYPDGRPALHDVSLTVAPGERVALVGPNGAGKSTLLLHFNGILQPQSGTVQVKGLEVQQDALGQVRAVVGLVFEDPNDQLFSPTVFEDVAFGPLYQGLSDAAVRERVTQALAAVGMEAYAARAPYYLSAGEKRRIAIATVLSMEPEVLVLDDPTAGLDPRGRRRLLSLLHTLPQALIVATHDLRMVAELCSRVVVLDGGAVVADGTAVEILHDAALLEAHGLEL